MQVLVTTIVSTLLLAPVPVVLTQSGSEELCPDGRDKQEFKDAVVDAGCNYSSRGDLLESFRRDTQLRHRRPGPSKYYVVCIPICSVLY